MNVTWLLSGSDIVNNQVLQSEINNYGDKYYIIKPFGELPEIEGPVMSLVPLDMCVRISKSKLYPGVYCNLKNLKCSSYYPYYQEYLLNKRFFMLPLANIPNMERDIFDDWLSYGQYEDVFIRPDSGFKTFTGCVVKRKGFADSINQLVHHAQLPDDLCLIAPPVNILKEWRFIIVNKEIIACSQYRDFSESPSGIPIPVKEVAPGAPDFVKEFVQNALNAIDWQPDKVYTMDVCQIDAIRLRIVEINCFSAAGLYRCNIPEVVSKVRQIVIDDWKDVYEDNTIH